MTQSTEVKKTEPASPQSIQKPVEEAKTVKEGGKASKDNSTFVIVSDEGISIIQVNLTNYEDTEIGWSKKELEEYSKRPQSVFNQNCFKFQIIIDHA